MNYNFKNQQYETSSYSPNMARYSSQESPKQARPKCPGNCRVCTGLCKDSGY